jgi:hypothetical protein
VCVRTVASALKHLRELGILNWVRRCGESWRDGRFVLEQDTNAYAVLPETQWRGYRPPAEPPVPEWERAPIMPSALDQAALAGDLAGQGAGVGHRSGQRPGSGPGQPGAGVHGARLVSFTGVHLMRMAARANRFRQPLALPERERATGCHRV